MKCAHCGEREATCIGRYDVMTEDEPACDECCGHGGEDGHCEQLPQLSEEQVEHAIEAWGRDSKQAGESIAGAFGLTSDMASTRLDGHRLKTSKEGDG